MKWTFFAKAPALPSLGVGAAVILLSGTPRAALDGKVYPGVQCMGSGYATSGLVHGANGSAINIGEATTRAFCPIVTDNENNQAGLNVARVRVLESDDTAEDTSCALYAISENGWFIDGNYDTVSGGGQQTISIPFNTSPVRARYQLLCWVSGFSGVTQYEIEEK